MKYVVPKELHTWDYHDFPECPEWFSKHLVELQDKAANHLLKITREEEEWTGEGKETVKTIIFVRYVPWNREDYLEYLQGRTFWKRVSRKAVCRECGNKFKRINSPHLKNVHGMSMEEYKEKHPNAEITSSGDFFKDVISEDDEFELVGGKTEAIEEEYGSAFIHRLRR